MGDSPTRVKHTRSAEYRSIHVADSRMTLTRDIPVVPEVHLVSLMDSVLPLLPLEGFEITCSTLVAAGHIKSSSTSNPRWACLPQDPCTSKPAEEETFKFLEDIAEAIINSHTLESQEHVALSITGRVVPLSFRFNTSRPDGFMYFKYVNSDKVRWADIVMPMEFKNKYEGKKKLDDYAKVMWSMHHIMRTDARRKFVYGLTCENTTMRLWYNDRSDIVVSDEFDVNTNWKHLVRIILSILLASPTQLGYDPTMVANPSDDGNSEPSYDIIIHNTDTGVSKYRTIHMLSDVGANSSVGRGTRVWAVRKLVDGVPIGPSYALKDVWVHDNRPPEHQVIKKIRQDQSDYAKHFLTPLDYGYVPYDPSESSIPDNTFKTIRHQTLKPTGRALRTLALSNIRPSQSKSQHTPSGPRDSIGGFEEIPSSSRDGRDISRLGKSGRQHYRILFEEIGEPVHALRNFKDIFTAIQGGWEGLHAIHLSGYVHRDVSSGNIMLVPASGALDRRGVIMDLEYAKEITDPSAPRDVRTGTLAFMATEVASMEHHRLGSLRKKPKMLDLASLKQAWKNETTKFNPLPPFRHNPLHDMESIWWLCTWTILYFIPSTSPSQNYIDNYLKIFFGKGSALAKRVCICDYGGFLNVTSHLSETAPFISPMERWRQQLDDIYTLCYTAYDDSPTPSTGIGIHDQALQLSYEWGKECLEQLESASKLISVDLVTLAERSNNSEYDG
ncbi:unnamed protein product [Rhizoctonia solani]|uniref:Fungal-type protein kinase domain-containing protein n=1 Tax=Rhizoctonia solani TaxID=456999 RepID=A0A8H3DSH0_9AGAM|nr:unnamed protein product [Rhizoctonia solani]CAE7082778.1 unnamed protein product [Rhizoctonia solani]